MLGLVINNNQHEANELYKFCKSTDAIKIVYILSHISPTEFSKSLKRLEQIVDFCHKNNILPIISIGMGTLFTSKRIHCNLFTYKRTEEINQYLQLALDLNPFKIALGWSKGEEMGAYYRWIKHYSYKNILNHIENTVMSTLSEFETMVKLFPEIETKKLMFTAIDVPFEREAYYYRNIPNRTPLRNWLNNHNAANIIFRGTWAVDKNIAEHLKYYTATDKDARSPIIIYDYIGKQEYPYAIYQQYLKQGEFYSGIGYIRGLKRNNYKTLLKIGYKGCFIYLGTLLKHADAKQLIISAIE